MVRTVSLPALLIVASMALGGCRTSMSLDDALKVPGWTPVDAAPRSVDDVIRVFRRVSDTPLNCAGGEASGGPEEFARRIRAIYDRAPGFGPFPAVGVQGPPGLTGNKQDVAREAGLIAYLRGEPSNMVAFVQWALDAIDAQHPTILVPGQLRPGWLAELNRHSELAFYLAHAGDFVGAERANSWYNVKRTQAYRPENPGNTNPARVPLADVAWSESQQARAKAAILRARGDLNRAATESYRAVQRIGDARRFALMQRPGTSPFEPIIAIADSELAETLRQQGRLVEAESLVRRALVRAPMLGTHTMLLWASLVVRLTEVVFDGGRPADAEALARVAIRVYRSECISVGSLAAAHAQDLLGRSLLLRGRSGEALEAYAAIGSSLRGEPRTLDLKYGGSLWWALAELLNGQHRAAAKRLGIGLARSVAVLDKEHRSVREIEGVLALAKLAAGDRDGAMSLFQRAIPALLREPGYGEGEAVDGGSRAWRLRLILDGWLDLLSDLKSRGGRLPGGTDPNDEAFRVMQVAATGDVPRALAAASARAVAGQSELGALIRREQDLGRSVGALEATLARLAGASGGSGGTSVAEGQALLARFIPARAVLRGEIQRRFPSYARLVDPQPVSIAEVQAVLRPGEAIVAVYSGGTRTWIWAVPAHGPAASAEASLSKDELDRLVASVRISVRPTGPGVADIPSYDVSAAHRLYREILWPVESAWRPARVVFTAVNGALAQVPFSLLVTEVLPELKGGPAFEDYRRVSWLARTHAAVSLPSLGSLPLLRALPAGGSEQLPFVGFGDPWFTSEQAARARDGQLAPTVGAADQTRAAGSMTQRRLPETRQLNRATLAQLPRLPETADEVRAIASALGANLTTDVFLGERATEDEVKRLDLSRRKVIVFATHGLVPGDLDGLTQPALALTSPAVTPSDGDGLLTMGEILNLKLNADWVVLSACNTAAADGAGSEALSGLGRAFLYAGARSLLVSHWAVYSDPTRLLMIDLFRRQALDPGAPRAELLRQAMLELLDNVGHRDSNGRVVFSYAHPIFWAPFAIIGDGGR